MGEHIADMRDLHGFPLNEEGFIRVCVRFQRLMRIGYTPRTNELKNVTVAYAHALLQKEELAFIKLCE